METLPASALAPGADLWIVPERKQSAFTQKIDWYLNFQIAKAVQHQSQDLSPIVGEILRSCALKNYDFLHEDSDALLILSTRNLPNRWVMVLKGSSDLNDWLQIALQKWRKMKSPSLRIFLPEGARINDVNRIWKKLGGDDSVTFVEETENGK